MSRKPLYLTVLFAVFFVLSSIAVSWARTQCLVMRGTNPPNTLWVSKCEDGNCGPFSQISGLFTSQPTVVWDHDTQRYYLYGTGLNGAVFRRTLNMLCQPVSGWQKMTADGVSASPIGAAAGDIYHTAKNNRLNGGIELTGTRTDLLEVNMAVPDDGFVACRASGSIHFGFLNTKEQINATIHIGKENLTYMWGVLAGFSNLSASATSMHIPFAVENWFTEYGRIDQTYYLYGSELGSGGDVVNTYVEHPTMTCQYHPYSF